MKQRITKLTLSNISTSGNTYPCLAHLKGRKIRMFSMVAVKLALEFRKEDDIRSQHRVLLMKAMNTVYSVCDEPAMV